MAVDVLTSGVVIGFGGTNARVAEARGGEIYEFSSVETPEQPAEFFGWMARQVLDAADAGNEWVVAGFPGPVSEDHVIVGPLANVPGLSHDQYVLHDELQKADPAVGDLLDERFELFSVNDGELAAHAVASRIGESKYQRPAALILGTGVGAGMVIKDPEHENVYRADGSPIEIGHAMLGSNPGITFENVVSGPALGKGFGASAEQLPADDHAWHFVGQTVAQMTLLLGLMNGADLAVPTGGVGVGASEKYRPHFESMIERLRQEGNSTQRHLLPDIGFVPEKDAQVFEMFGGEGVARDFMSQSTAPIAHQL